ncbi:MAG TPA: transcriptional regulator, partial [Verrucomicrobiae bacterium]|nr:transcriptional regulator [Verrucomicrobiae bacterium]
MKKSEDLIAPVHPGEILREDFMKPLGLTVNKLALELHVPATR